MIMAVIFKNGKEIDRGIVTGGKKWVKAYPEQYVTICNDCSAYHINNERTYTHDDEISFQELQKNNDVWEIVYDSNERIDKTVEYPLPRWMYDSNASIPNYNHKIKDNDIESDFRGYVR